MGPGMAVGEAMNRGGAWPQEASARVMGSCGRLDPGHCGGAELVRRCAWLASHGGVLVPRAQHAPRLLRA